jgi:predicted RNase H-like HicB family nuclease
VYLRTQARRSVVQTRAMKQAQPLTAIIEREDEGFVALCPELDVASQGDSIETARANLIEALTLFFETASSSEIDRRTCLHARDDRRANTTLASIGTRVQPALWTRGRRAGSKRLSLLIQVRR